MFFTETLQTIRRTLPKLLYIWTNRNVRTPTEECVFVDDRQPLLPRTSMVYRTVVRRMGSSVWNPPMKRDSVHGAGEVQDTEGRTFPLPGVTVTFFQITELLSPHKLMLPFQKISFVLLLDHQKRLHLKTLSGEEGLGISQRRIPVDLRKRTTTTYWRGKKRVRVDLPREE